MAENQPEETEQTAEETAEETASAEETPAEPETAAKAEAPAEPEASEAVEPAAPELTLGEGPPAEEAAEPAVAPTIRGKIDKFGAALGTGRRKTSVARVRVTPGDGALTINGRALDEYFKTDRTRKDVLAPLEATETEGKVNIWVRVQGGGPTGQAGAVVLGIARALQAMDPSLHHRLSDGGYLTRDPRMVERKKYGYRKARRSFQFSKR